MAKIGDVPEINAVKLRLNEFIKRDLISRWELPYENLLTRLSAAIFFFDLVDEGLLNEVMESLGDIKNILCRKNSERKLSSLEWRMEFDEKFVLSADVTRDQTIS